MVTTNTLTQAQMGVLNHIALGVPNMEAAYTKLWNDDRLQGQIDARGQQIIPKSGATPSGSSPAGSRRTRAEVMELHAIASPAARPLPPAIRKK